MNYFDKEHDSRGGLVNTQAVIAGLKSDKLGYVGINVYEQEESFSSAIRGAVLYKMTLFSD